MHMSKIKNRTINKTKLQSIIKIFVLLDNFIFTSPLIDCIIYKCTLYFKDLSL